MKFLRRLFSGGKWIQAGDGKSVARELCDGYYKLYGTTRYFHTGTCEYKDVTDSHYIVFDRDGMRIGGGSNWL